MFTARLSLGTGPVMDVGRWAAPDEVDQWVRSLRSAGFPVVLHEVVPYLSPKQFLAAAQAHAERAG